MKTVISIAHKNIHRSKMFLRLRNQIILHMPEFDFDFCDKYFNLQDFNLIQMDTDI